MKKTSRAVIIDDNKILVFFRRKIRDGNEVTYYALPGGHVEDGETLEDTVVREIKEEMNLDVSVLGYLGKIVVGDTEEYYYHCGIDGGVLQFGGEELERNCDTNYYEIRKLPISGLDTSDIRAEELVKKALVLDYED